MYEEITIKLSAIPVEETEKIKEILMKSLKICPDKTNEEALEILLMFE